MVKQLLILSLIAFFSMSCSKSDIEESSPSASNGKPTSEPISTSKEIEEGDKNIPTTNTEKTANWVANMQHINGLLESSEGSNFVSLYDNALATLLFIDHMELEKAEHILEFFNDRIETELKSGTGGFYQFRNKDGANANRTWMGDNAWLLLAINHYHEATGNQKYDRLAKELENWLRSLQDVDGGLWGGRNEDGTQIPKVTEGIITAFNAIEGYDDFHKNILHYLRENRWNENKKILMADTNNARYRFALDLHALGQSIFEEFPEENLLQTDILYGTSQWSTVTGEEITGYCFDTDKDVIWLEGTAQMAVAFRQNGDTERAEELLLALEKTTITSSLIEDAMGIPYATNPGTNYGATILWAHADIAPTLSSTVWYLFAKGGFNPLELGRQKNIPVADMFWMEGS